MNQPIDEVLWDQLGQICTVLRVWDGNLISKDARDKLVRVGWVEKSYEGKHSMPSCEGARVWKTLTLFKTHNQATCSDMVMTDMVMTEMGRTE